MQCCTEIVADNPIKFDLYKLHVVPIKYSIVEDQIIVLKLDLRKKTNNTLKCANSNTTLDCAFSLGLKCNVQWTQLLFWNHVCVLWVGTQCTEHSNLYVAWAIIMMMMVPQWQRKYEICLRLLPSLPYLVLAVPSLTFELSCYFWAAMGDRLLSVSFLVHAVEKQCFILAKNHRTWSCWFRNNW